MIPQLYFGRAEHASSRIIFGAYALKNATEAAAMHLRSLERFDFDSVMLSYSHVLMQNPRYAANVEALFALCRERNVAIQTIKSTARRPWAGRAKTHNTWFYEPLVAQEAIDKTVHWVLGNPNVFLITAGDMELLPKVLDAAERFEKQPSDAEMAAVSETYGVEAIFR